jgi:hypothetical protein
MMMQRFFSVACAAFVLAAVLPVQAQTTGDALFGKNLVVNGDAEADTGAPSNSQIVKPTGWTTTGQFTVVQYGASGGFPDKTSVGPTDRGNNFFAGGNIAKSTASQTIDLSTAGATIDAGGVTFVLSGWLGGFNNQDDSATVSVTFVSESGAVLRSAAIGPLKAADRKDVTGFFQRKATGVVPAHARSARIVITATRFAGEYNDSYSDDISLVLAKKV